MLKNLNSRRGQRGIGLLELMLSLAIISVLLVMATRYYKAADQGQKISNAISLVSGIAGAAAQYLSTHPGQEVSLKVLVESNYLPNNFLTITSPWGTALELSGKGTVTVTMKAVPKDPCTILKTSLSGTDGKVCAGAEDVVVNY